jgi:hypothetical protein
MNIPVFLSYPKPHMERQQKFILAIQAYLTERGLEGRTLGQNEYDMNAPLAAVRRLMLESNGMLVVAFRRYWIERGEENHEGDVTPPRKARSISRSWMTSEWCHMEAAMAFQLALPLLVLREEGVLSLGVLQHGVTGTYMPEFNLRSPMKSYFKTQEWKQLIAQWEGKVREVREAKGKPPLFGI